MEKFEEDALESHNELRARHGVEPLTLDREVLRSAYQHVKVMFLEWLVHRTKEIVLIRQFLDFCQIGKVLVVPDGKSKFWNKL
jgi:hypothetical protein